MIDRMRLVDEIIYPGVNGIGGAEDRLSASSFLSGDHMSETVNTAIRTPSASRSATSAPLGDLLCELFGNVERDRDRPERLVGQTHISLHTDS